MSTNSEPMTSSVASVSSIETLNMQFQQTIIGHLHRKLARHLERYEALELKEAHLTVKRSEIDGGKLLHFYVTAQREMTRETMTKIKEKLENLKNSLEELLEKN